VKSKDDLQKLTTVPIAGTIIHNKKYGDDLAINIPVVDSPRSVFSESMRALRTNLDYFHSEKGPLIIGVHSVVPGEGKSFVSLNLASIISMNNRKVILIDADMRKPTLSKSLKISSNKEGLSTYLIGRSKLSQIIRKTHVENFDVIIAGTIPPNPAELLSSSAFRTLIADLKEDYDVIIIDNAPSSLVTDAAIVRQYTNIDLFVVR
jgi:capsular exopolysaccharide synthesis family protein